MRRRWNAARAAAGGSARLLASRRVAALGLFAAVAVWLAFCLSTQRYYYIFDGRVLTVHRTSTDDPEVALMESGVSIRPQDLVLWPEEPSAGFSEIYIERADTVAVRADGEEISVTARNGTVETALLASGMSLGTQDAVLPSLGTPLEDGMTITVTRVGMRREEIWEELPYETEYVSTKRLLRGQESVTRDGTSGYRLTAYDVVTHDGVDVLRTVLHEEEEEPVSEIIEVGTQDYLITPDGEVLRYSRMLEVSATAYTTERQEQKRNAIGNIARRGTIAVDPRVIPLRSRVYVQDPQGRWIYGIAVCEDTGGAVKGNIIDLFFDTWDECIRFGRRRAVVYIIS